jgi:hypothetical protein
MAAMPAYAHMLALFPGGDACADVIAAADDLMAGNAGKLDPRPKAVFYKDIAAANTAGFHF